MRGGQEKKKVGRGIPKGGGGNKKEEGSKRRRSTGYRKQEVEQTSPTPICPPPSPLNNSTSWKAWLAIQTCFNLTARK